MNTLGRRQRESTTVVPNVPGTRYSNAGWPPYEMTTFEADASRIRRVRQEYKPVFPIFMIDKATMVAWEAGQV